MSVVSVDEGTQLVAIAVVIVALLAELPVAVVVSVNVAPPLGLLMLTTELAGKALYRAAARLAGVAEPVYPPETLTGPTVTPEATTVNCMEPASAELLEVQCVPKQLVELLVVSAPPIVTETAAEVAGCEVAVCSAPLMLTDPMMLLAAFGSITFTRLPKASPQDWRGLPASSKTVVQITLAPPLPSLGGVL
jgi:hypothetical protein